MDFTQEELQEIASRALDLARDKSRPIDPAVRRAFLNLGHVALEAESILLTVELSQMKVSEEQVQASQQEMEPTPPPEEPQAPPPGQNENGRVMQEPGSSKRRPVATSAPDGSMVVRDLESDETIQVIPPQDIPEDV